jgi:AcrR family transcriptional regulator
MNNTEIETAARRRLHEAMLEELGDRGLDGIRLRAVLARAGVSESDFTTTYDGVEECLFEAYAALTDRLDAVVRDACRDAAEAVWADRVRAGLTALIGELVRDPGRAAVLVHGFPAIGPSAQARFQAFVESFAPMLEAGRREAGGEAELPSEVETLAVGAAEALVFEEIVAGRAAALEALLPSILFALLVPFVGPVRAGAEMSKHQP